MAFSESHGGVDCAQNSNVCSNRATAIAGLLRPIGASHVNVPIVALA